MKTILDAVNTLKATWPSESIQIIEIDGVEFSEKEFIICVAECSNSFGLPSVTAKPIYTQYMSDVGEFPPIGSMFITSLGAYRAVYVGDHLGGKSVVGQGEKDLLAFRRECCRPIDNRIPKQKAFDVYLDSEYNLSKNEFLEASSEDGIFVTKLESAFNAGVKWMGK